MILGNIVKKNAEKVYNKAFAQEGDKYRTMEKVARNVYQAGVIIDKVENVTLIAGITILTVKKIMK